MDLLLLECERFALWGDALALVLKLFQPAAQRRIHDAQLTPGLDMAVALIQHQGSCLAFELGGKRTALFAHRTPLNGEDFA